MTAISGWTSKKLTELATYINGYAFKPEDWGSEGLPIVRIEQLRNPEAPTDFFSGKLPPSVVIEDGDLIFSWSASLFLRIWIDGQAALNQHLFKVIEKKGVDRAFLKSFIEFYLPALTAASHGSAMQHITRKELHRFGAACPDSIHEQGTIADIIATVERAIEQTEALVAKCQRIKAGLMMDFFTRGVDERGNLRSEQTHPFKDSQLGRVPEAWQVKPISSYAPKNRPWLRTGPFGSDLNTRHWVSHGVPVLTIGSLGEGEVDEAELLYVNDTVSDALKGFRVSPGDVVFSRVADIGRSLVIRPQQDGWIISSNLMRISLDTARASPEFLYRNIAFNPVIRSQLRSDSNSGGRDLVNGPILAGLLFPWPDLCEQERIISRLLPIEEQLRSLQSNLAKAVSLKRALMHDLLTGQKRVISLLKSGPQRERIYAQR